MDAVELGGPVGRGYSRGTEGEGATFWTAVAWLFEAKSQAETGEEVYEADE